jgi:ABC-2 type transport system ATP-binding protein
MDVLAHPALAGSAIACLGLTKDYGGGHGLFDLDLEVRRGEVFGFIGANGAGKTTTMRLIMDLIRPDRGSVGVLGLDAHRQSLEIKRRVGYLTGELPQYPGVKAARVVGLLAGLRGGVDPARISLLAERLQLDLDRRFSDLSHGNKQKVGLVTAFMHEPELLILDEPTLGLDPLMQREVRTLIEEAVANGATCMISSHVLAEIELVCDRIGLIREGRLVRVGTLEELRSLRVHRIQAILPRPVAAAELAAMAGVSEVATDGDLVSCSVRGPITPLLSWLSEQGAVELDSRELSLEEVFLAEYEPAP